MGAHTDKQDFLNMSSADSDVLRDFTIGVDRINWDHTALVVVDMQYASACRHTGLGRWLSEHGRKPEGDYRFDRIENLVVPNIQQLLDVWRTHDLPRVFVRLGATDGLCRDLVPWVRELEYAFGNVVGRREFEILDELRPVRGEPIITKLSASAFTSSSIDALLRNMGVMACVFTGVSTSQCVDLTARDASDRGYISLIVEDAVAEDRQEYHDATLVQFARLFGSVMATQSVAELVMKNAAGARQSLARDVEAKSRTARR